MDSFYQSAYPDETYYTAELMNRGCVKEKNTGLLNDPRYTVTGLYVNQEEVYSENGVLDILTDQSNYKKTGAPDADTMATYMMQGWSRPTIGWAIECDDNGKTR